MFRFLADNARWLAAGFLLTLMSGFGQTYFISLFSGEIRGELGLSHGGFGTLYGAATLLSAVTIVWVGRLADLPNAALVGVIVSLMMALAAVTMSFATVPIALFFAIYGLRLFGQGMMTHVSQTLMGRWFVATRGRAIAISGFGFPVSEATFPVTVVLLLTVLGWREVWLIAACVLVFVSAPVLWWLLRADRTPTARSTASGEAEAPVQRQWTRGEVLRDPVFFFLLPAFLAPSFIGTGVFFHQVHLTEEKGWELAWFASFFPVYAASQVGTSLVTGFLVDRWSARHVLPFVLVPQGIGAALLGSTGDPMVVPLTMATFGMTAGMMSTVSGSLWPEIYGVLHLGAIRAMAISAMVLSTAAAPFVLGLLIDAGVSFDSQLFGMATYMFCASVLLVPVARMLLARDTSEPAPVT
ncbi:MFS transporter [Tepidamorphus sp. 3E244]|uniref:MFS transporter n=1 Tax=Tepidamorphus sp. 3E244 TaxID=3385498 RepID=UPI0038FC4559